MKMKIFLDMYYLLVAQGYVYVYLLGVTDKCKYGAPSP